MKEHPILFSTEMVKAILRGEKTQTRRAINRQPEVDKFGLVNIVWIEKENFWVSPEKYIEFFKQGEYLSACPYGKIGDQLWVRENFSPNYFDDNKPAYKADWTTVAGEIVREPKWKPSIHMPRSVSRIQLEIVNIKVEQLQDITEEDSIAEGIEYQYPGESKAIFRDYQLKTLNGYPTAKQSFASLWDLLNEKRGFGWEKNPFVWRIKFRRIK